MDHFPDHARMWIYQSARVFNETETSNIRREVQQFAAQWVSHQVQMRATAEVLYNRFIVLMADEEQVHTGGCSIDKSVSFLKALQEKYQTDLFNRMIFSYLQDGKVHTVNRDEFAKLYAAGKINDETPVLDTLVQNKADFNRSFIKPLGISWHKRMV
jgi:DNA polymerase I-like protein with 3'-5' exonuclease and polymerase domains